MKLILCCVLLFGCISVMYARPRYIAIPLDDLEVLEVADLTSPLVRLPRRTADQLPEQDSRVERQAHGHDAHDYVDYGAHTGHHGAFGWYADFPVLTH